jgi:aminobenzoyl-glutamate transport protein
MAQEKRSGSASELRGILGWIERTGNTLPDPVMIFAWLMLATVIISTIAAFGGLSAAHPVTGEIIKAKNLLSGEQIRHFLVEMPNTFTGFRPLGMVLVVMLGAGVAERCGLFGTAMRAAVRQAPMFLLTPSVAFVAMMGNLAADAAYVVLIPLAGVIYASAGRNPIAGIAAAFAGVSGGFSANLLPGQLDALLFGITEEAAQFLDPAYSVDIAGNWWFIVGMLVVYIPVIWIVTDWFIEPRLGKWSPDVGSSVSVEADTGALSSEESKGLRWAGIAALITMAIWAFLVFGPGTPLQDLGGKPQDQFKPLFESFIAFFFVLFLVTAIAYGTCVGSIRSHRDVVDMMSRAMGDMSYYIVLAFVAAHFVAFFGWSNLGLILAVNGAEVLKSSELPAPALLAMIIFLSAGINLFVGSASAKWGMLAPVVVPMLMLLSISPEMTTAAYRVGDSATNIVTPLMPYFPLVLAFCQRWRRDFGLGSLMAIMIPYGIWIMIIGTTMTVAWVYFNLPLSPNAVMQYQLPQ